MNHLLAFPLSVQLQIFFVPLERGNAYNVILHTTKLYHVACGKVCPVANLKQNFFVKLCSDVVQLLHFREVIEKYDIVNPRDISKYCSAMREQAK